MPGAHFDLDAARAQSRLQGELVRLEPGRIVQEHDEALGLFGLAQALRQCQRHHERSPGARQRSAVENIDHFGVQPFGGRFRADAGQGDVAAAAQTERLGLTAADGDPVRQCRVQLAEQALGDAGAVFAAGAVDSFADEYRRTLPIRRHPAHVELGHDQHHAATGLHDALEAFRLGMVEHDRLQATVAPRRPAHDGQVAEPFADHRLLLEARAHRGGVAGEQGERAQARGDHDNGADIARAMLQDIAQGQQGGAHPATLGNWRTLPAGAANRRPSASCKVRVAFPIWRWSRVEITNAVPWVRR